MPTKKVPYYVTASLRDNGLEVYERFMAANPRLSFRDREVGTLGGLLISRPNSRYGYTGSEEKWGRTADYRRALDHVEFLYDSSAGRAVLVSLPNFELDSDGHHPCGCLERLIEECERVSALHQNSKPGSSNPGERLMVHIGSNGTSWRRAGHPLVVVASNRVLIKV